MLTSTVTVYPLLFGNETESPVPGAAAAAASTCPIAAASRGHWSLASSIPRVAITPAYPAMPATASAAAAPPRRARMTPAPQLPPSAAARHTPCRGGRDIGPGALRQRIDERPEPAAPAPTSAAPQPEFPVLAQRVAGRSPPDPRRREPAPCATSRPPKAHWRPGAPCAMTWTASRSSRLARASAICRRRWLRLPSRA